MTSYPIEVTNSTCQISENVLNTIKKRKANLIHHILHRICLLKHVTEGTIEGRLKGMGR